MRHVRYAKNSETSFDFINSTDKSENNVNIHAYITVKHNQPSRKNIIYLPVRNPNE